MNSVIIACYHVDFWHEIVANLILICIFAAIESWKSGILRSGNGWKSDVLDLKNGWKSSDIATKYGWKK